MSSERSSTSKQAVVIGLAIGAAALVGAVLALRPVATTPPPTAEVPKDKPPAAPAASAQPSAAANPHALHPLSRWEGPFAFDVLGYLPEATRLAQERYSDAVLTDLRLSKVKPVGRINLKAKDSSAAYRFRSPSRSANGATPGAEPCLLEVVVTGEGVQVTTPEAPAAGCSSPGVALPECDLLQMWLVTLQETTPAEPSGHWELAAAPGTKADAPAAPGHWQLTMPATPEPFVRRFDASCNPIGRTLPIAPVDANRFRAEAALAPKPNDPNAPTVIVRPVSVRGPVPIGALQDILSANLSGYEGCFTRSSSACGNCLKGVTATVSFTVGDRGTVITARAHSSTMQENLDDKAGLAADQFGQCVVEQVIKALTFPPAPETTDTVFKVSVTAP